MSANQQPQAEPVGHLYRDHHGVMQFQWTAISGEGLVDGTKLYTAPQPQADSRSPSYDALLLMMQSVCGALERAGIKDTDDPGEAIDVMRERLERRIAELSAQAPQPQAKPEREYTMGDWFNDLDNPHSNRAAHPRIAGGGP